MRLSCLTPFATSLALATALVAQVPHGYALVCWKPQNPTATGGLRLVDRAGANTAITGLDADTVGTTRWDGAQSILVDDFGVAYAGIGADNRTGSSPLRLGIRRIVLSGSTAASDTLFSTLMMVPAGELWTVSDIKQRRDGSLLVAASQILMTANPMPQTQAFVVDVNGNATALPNGSFPAGSLLAIADAGPFFLGAFMQQFFITNIEIWAFSYQPNPPGFRVFQFVNTSRFGGMDVDVNGEIVAGAPFSGSSMARMPVVPSATPTPVPSTPATVAVCDVLPAAGLAAAFAQPSLVAGALNVVDTLAGGFTQWAATVVRDPIDVSVRADTTAYGLASTSTGSNPYLGSLGGWPRIGNAGFGLRIGGTANSPGIVLASPGRGAIGTPFGTLLLSPSLLIVISSFALSSNGTATLPLGLPNDPSLVGVRVDMQSIAISGLAPVTVEMSQGLEMVVLGS